MTSFFIEIHPHATYHTPSGLLTCNFSEIPYPAPTGLHNADEDSADADVALEILEDGYDIRTVREPLGHKNVKTTMVYTHPLNRWDC
jgi:hypothetical protein